MPPKLQRLRQRFPSKVLIWTVLTLLVAIGVLLTISDLAGVPAQETMRANSVQQRVIVDPNTGVVSGLAGNTANASPFEVAEEEAQEEAAPVEEEGVHVAEGEPAATPEPEAEVEPVPVTENAPDQHEPLMLARQDDGVPQIARTRDSLVMAPAPEISEKESKELLPIRGEADAGREAPRASALYARSFTRRADQHLVAIVVTDVGFSAQVLGQVISLPGEVAVGFSPYADNAAKQIEALRNRGHEVWAMLPAMGTRYPQDDPGPLGMIGALTIKGAMERLHTLMANTIGSVGFILPPDETISQQADLWNAIRDEIDERGLYILSTHPTRDARELGASTDQERVIRRADILLDSTPGAAFIKSKLAGIKEASANDPELVVLVSARPQALTLLGEWLGTDPLGEEALLVPLSAIYADVTAPIEVATPKEEGGHGGGH